MSAEPFVLDVATEQFERMDAPTVIVPVAQKGRTGVFFATYEGDEEWMAHVRVKELQAEVAIALCKRAHADARKHCDVDSPVPNTSAEDRR